jgi:hypothetical protein
MGPMPVQFDDDWDFIYGTFEQLKSPFVGVHAVGEAIRLESDIWKLLQEKEALGESAPADGLGRDSIGVGWPSD